MSSSDTPTGENGRKELKVVQSDKDYFKEYFDEYIDELQETGKYYSVDCIVFDVPKETIKDRAGSSDDKSVGFSEIQNVEPGTRELISNPEQHKEFKCYNVETKKAIYEKFKKASEKAKQEGIKRRENLDENKANIGKVNDQNER